MKILTHMEKSYSIRYDVTKICVDIFESKIKHGMMIPRCLNLVSNQKNESECKVAWMNRS